MIHKTTLFSVIELAWFEVKIKYARSILGPFWITLSMIIFISGLSFVFVSLFGVSVNKTMPWIALGIVIWNYISSYIDDSSTLFIHTRLTNMRITPLKLIVINMFKHLIIFAHNSLVIVAIILIFNLKITYTYFYLIFAFIIIIANSISFGILIGFLCCRYRDFILIIRNLIYLMFLMTPIFWMPDLLKGNRMILADINIVYQVIQSVRDPLLGNPLSGYTILYLSIFTFFISIFSFFIYKKFHRRLIFWI